MRAFYGVLASFRVAFGPAPEAIAGHLNEAEVRRVVAAALSAAATLGSMLGAIQSVTGPLFPAPFDAAVACLIFVTTVEGRRRLAHGTVPERARGCRRK